MTFKWLFEGGESAEIWGKIFSSSKNFLFQDLLLVEGLASVSGEAQGGQCGSGRVSEMENGGPGALSNLRQDTE